MIPAVFLWREIIEKTQIFPPLESRIDPSKKKAALALKSHAA